ncbi:MAG: glycosyltransferase family 4 protein [Gemmatimonadaceae bacterium]|nr:glycosyltransferase family 4 protein [Gemmatimonadaceae bacterium]
MGKYNIGFIMEQALGHVTHTQNLRANMVHAPDVEAFWTLPQFEPTGLGARLPLYRSNWSVRASMQARSGIARLQRQTRLDALFFHTQVTAVLAAKWLRRIPSIVSLDATPLQYDQLGTFYQHTPGPAIKERLSYRLNRECFQVARHLVTWSAWAKQSLVDDYGIADAKITVIPPGAITRDWLRPEPRGHHDGPVKILFVGASLERKGGHLLLNAFRALRSLGVELHLVTRDRVAPEPGLFVYHDMQPNSQPLKDLYHACDIFALPTFADCLPMVLSEAGAAGLPAVSTTLAGIPEIVRHEETGMLVPVGDEAALTRALRTLVEQPELRLRLGERAITTTTREFDATHNAIRLFDLLKHEVDAERATARRA